ncbi:MAG: RDD family protein [Pseudomonadales bacterium]|nr:RDD family protein [Pseudomonadales bacterium]
MSIETTDFPNAGFIRRIAALIYDSFLVVAVWMASMTPIVVYVGGGQAVTGWVLQLFLYVEWFFFYYIFWRIKGQTLGMQVWKIKTIGPTGEMMTSVQCILRWLVATLTLIPFGLGFFWMLVDRERLTLYDRLTRTRCIYLGKNPYPSEKKKKA